MLTYLGIMKRKILLDRVLVPPIYMNLSLLVTRLVAVWVVVLSIGGGTLVVL